MTRGTNYVLQPRRTNAFTTLFFTLNHGPISSNFLTFREGIFELCRIMKKYFQECFQSLKHCFGDQYPPKAVAFRWFRQFMSGARTLEDDDRCGRMTTTVNPENVSGVESLIKKDPKMTYAEIQDIMKISSGSLTRSLHDCLGVRKRCARWVPHNLSEEQKWGTVDWCPVDPSKSAHIQTSPPETPGI